MTYSKLSFGIVIIFLVTAATAPMLNKTITIEWAIIIF